MNRRAFLTGAVTAGTVVSARAAAIPPFLFTKDFASLVDRINKQGKIATVSEKTSNALDLRFGSLFLERTDVNDNPLALSESELSDEFIPFQGTIRNGRPVLLAPSQVNPSVETTKQQPDVRLSVSMQALHLGTAEKIKKGTRGTLVLTINKDEAGPSSAVDTLFWAVVTGLNLWNNQSGSPAKPHELSANFHQAFAGRRIEIPGGLGNICLQVVRHKEPSWWHNVFRFASGPAGIALTSALGFPAVAAAALPFVQQIWERLDREAPEVLFASSRLKVAFSTGAREESKKDGFSKLGALNPGTWVLVRGRDINKLREARPYFDETNGLLMPTAPGLPQNPLREITYIVLKASIHATKLES